MHSTGSPAELSPSNEARKIGFSSDIAHTGSAMSPCRASQAVRQSSSWRMPYCTAGIDDRSLSGSNPIFLHQSASRLEYGSCPRIVLASVAVRPSRRHACHSGVRWSMLQNFTFASIEKAPAAGLDFLLLSEEFSGSADRRGENQRPSSLTAGLMTDGSCGNCGTLPFASSCSRKAGKAGMEAHFIPSFIWA